MCCCLQRQKFAAVVREKQSWFRDRMCNRITAHARPSDYHLVRAAPRHPANVSHGQIEICQRSPFPDSSNRKSRGPAPPAWVPILWLTTAREKTLVMVVGVTQWDQPPAKQFCCSENRWENLQECCRGSGFRVLFFCAQNCSKNAHFGWVIVRAILVFIL